MTFDPHWRSPLQGLPDSAWPTINQLAAIGTVVNAWSWLDLAVQNLLCRLVQSATHLSQTLTEDLSPDNRIKALRRLAHTLDSVFLNITGEQAAAIAEIDAVAKWMAANKAKRNNIAHYLWLRNTDEKMFGWKYSLAIRDDHSRPELMLAWRDLVTFSEEIGAMITRVDAVEKVVRNWPDWPQSWRER